MIEEVHLCNMIFNLHRLSFQLAKERNRHVPMFLQLIGILQGFHLKGYLLRQIIPKVYFKVLEIKLLHLLIIIIVILF